MKKLIVPAVLLSLLFSPFSVNAHSGRTDSSGGHNCSEKSIAKGLCTGYHYHNGGGSSSTTTTTPAPKPAPAPVVQPKPAVQPTPKPVTVPKPTYQSADVKVVLDNKQLSFTQSPVIVNGRTLVPLRTIFEALGASIAWDGTTKTVTATKGTTTIKLTVGQTNAYKNSQVIKLDTSAVVVNGSTMVPARFVGESFGAKVGWDSNTKVITIDTDSEESDDSQDATQTTSSSTTSSGNVTTGKLLEVHYIDVGQGDATYIKTPNGEDILIDAGDNSKGDEVVNYLRKLGVDDIEIMIATHPDADHTGGLDTVLKEFTVESVYAPKVGHNTQTFEDFLLAVQDEGLTIKTAKSGVTLPIQGATATFVAPVKEYGDELNDWSAAMHLAYGNTSFLFTGDAEENSEKDIVSSNQTLKADVLKVGHHGSDTSTTPAFLQAVDPKYAVISVGEDNRYGHPTQGTLDKLDGKIIYRTDINGTVRATSDGKNITFTAER